MYPVYNAFAQTPESSLELQLISLAKANSDQQSTYNTVLSTLERMDSTARCSTLASLQAGAPLRNYRYHLWLTILRNHLQPGRSVCPGGKGFPAELNDALRIAYEKEDDIMVFHLHQIMSSGYTSLSNFGDATLHALIALEIAERSGNKITTASANWFGLGYVLFHSREYEASLAANYKALANLETTRHTDADSLNMSFLMNTWNTIGLCYEKLHKPDSAFHAFDQALGYARRFNAYFWTGVIQGNRGDMFYQLGQYDSARMLLQMDYERSLAAGIFHNAANSRQWLARIDLAEGKTDAALSQMRESIRLLAMHPHPPYLVNSLYGMAQVYAHMDVADSVNYYMQQYVRLHDSIEQEAYASRAGIVTMRMDNQASVHRIQALNKEKLRVILVRNLFIIIILLAGAFGFMFFNRSRLKLRLSQQQALEEKKLAQAASASSKEQLAIYTQMLREKTGMVDALQEQLSRRMNSEVQGELIEALSQHSILTDADWIEFKRLFEKVYPGFFQSLKNQSEDISVAEQRMAALCKLQLSNKECANLLGISTASVNKTRQRLRHRLGLDPEANLEEYFQDIHF